MKKICFAFILGIFALSMFSVGMTLAAVEVDGQVVLVDNYYSGYHANDYDNFIGNLTEWGYEFRNLTTSFADADLSDVDIIITMTAEVGGEKNYTTADIAAVKAWFEEGEKGLWVAADSDFSDATGDVAAGANGLLEEVGSNILIEQASVESEYNSGAAYRVRAGIYNMAGIGADINANVTHNSGYFHGPAPLIAELSNGTYIAMEGNEAMLLSTYNITWICKAGNATATSTIVQSSGPGLPYRAHDDNDEGNFVLMAVQTIGESKLIVSGEAPFSDYKLMFNDPNEKDDGNDNPLMVKNAVMWMTFEKAGAGTPGFEVFVAVMALVSITAILRKRK